MRSAMVEASKRIVLKVHPLKGVTFIGGSFKVSDFRKELVKNAGP